MGRPAKYDMDLVLDKAVHLFWRKGYEATCMQDLVQELGMHPGSIYNTFGDKHGLFLAALNHYAQNDGQYLIKLLSLPGSPLQVIENLMLYSAKYLAGEEGRKGCLMTNSAAELATTDPMVAASVNSYGHQFETALVEVMNRAQSLGEIQPRSAEDTLAQARFIHACLQGMRLMAKGRVAEEQLVGIAKTALSVLN